MAPWPRAAAQTRAILLASAGGEAPDAAAVRRHAGEDRRPAATGRLGGPLNVTALNLMRERGKEMGKCVRTPLKNHLFVLPGSKMRQLSGSWMSFPDLTPGAPSVCLTATVNASLMQLEKWKFRLRQHQSMRPAEFALDGGARVWSAYAFCTSFQFCKVSRCRIRSNR
jgi:hypothetical protein